MKTAPMDSAWPRVWGRGWLAASYVFLFLPIISLIVFSFNDSPIPNLWRGFTWRWYANLGADVALLEALWASLKVALATASAAVLLGSLAAFALVKIPRFRGRTLFGGMVSAPLVMPEVVIGLSLLLTMVSVQRAVGLPERGLFTIWLGHLLVGMAYATVIIQARLRDLDPRLEEVAMDLGARPAQVYRLVTLPLILPSVIAAWLLTFTLSLDDVVLAAFLSGPGASTMPLVVFSRARMGLNPGVNAVAALIVVAVGVGVAVACFLMARAEQQRARRQSRPMPDDPATRQWVAPPPRARRPRRNA